MNVGFGVGVGTTLAGEAAAYVGASVAVRVGSTMTVGASVAFEKWVGVAVDVAFGLIGAGLHPAIANHTTASTQKSLGVKNMVCGIICVSSYWLAKAIHSAIFVAIQLYRAAPKLSLANPL